MTTKITSIGGGKRQPTYLEVLKDHVKLINEDDASKKVDIMFIGGITEEGVFYTLLEGGTALEIVGLLDILKTNFMFDNMGD